MFQRRCIAPGQLSGIHLRGAAASGIDWNGLRTAARDLAYAASALVPRTPAAAGFACIVLPMECLARPLVDLGIVSMLNFYLRK